MLLVLFTLPRFFEDEEYPVELSEANGSVHPAWETAGFGEAD